jgi:hypothetical protein
MSTALVSITLHGLIALVPVNVANDPARTLTPGGLQGANHIAALLVDADVDTPNPETSCIARHQPVVEFPLTDSSRDLCIDQPACEILPPAGADGPERCSCSAAGRKIWLTPDRVTAGRKFQAWAPAELPPSRSQPHQPDFSYFPNLNQLGYPLDRAFLNGDPGGLAARMVFPFDELLTCTLAVRPFAGERSTVHAFDFRKLNDLPGAHQAQPRPQAAAQQLVVHTQYDGAKPLRLQLSDFDDSHQVAFLLPPSGPVDIVLSNEREHLELDDPCNDGVGRDFSLFYKLSAHPPADWKQAPLPHLVPTQAIELDQVNDPRCPGETSKGMMSRPICTMASFIE